MTSSLQDPDDAGIYQAASDYYRGWYDADVERIGRSLHPELAKRALRRHESGSSFLHNLTKERMLELTKEGGGSEIPKAKQHYDIIILDRYEEIASVKVIAYEYIDYLHLVKQDGEWLIVNALWTDNRVYLAEQA